MKAIGISEVLEEAWGLAKRHAVMMAIFLVAIYIITYVIQAVIGGSSSEALVLASQSGDPEALLNAWSAMIPAATTSGIVGIAMMVGVLALVLDIVKGKKDKVDFSGFQQSPLTYLKVVCAYVLYSFIISVGTACCIIPGLFLATRLFLTPTAILDDPELPFLDAFKKSWQMTKGNFWNLLLLGIVLVIINLIGICCCCVGILFTYSLTLFAQMIVFLTLKNNLATAEEPVDPRFV